MTAQANLVEIEYDDSGVKMVVDGDPIMVNGMNWDYFPIGTNYSYNLWEQSDLFIESVLDYEMGLLQNMGVNAIRVYTGIQPKWIEYIYKNYGIFTMLNHSFGRYGLEIDGQWIAKTDYGDPKTQEILLSQVSNLANTYKDTPGLLLFLLGNENNYGLSWEGAETEDIPVDTPAIEDSARDLYKLFNQGVLAMKKVDDHHPVAICNGDLQFLDLIKEECPDIDIFGANVYRGISFDDAFSRAAEELEKPMLLTEFGADAFNALKKEVDQQSQAFYLLGNWKEIYQNAAGMGKAENSLGGFTFQFSDGWWKYGQTTNLSVQDDHASWSNGGYESDYKEGFNNMNEEWFGICAKGSSHLNEHYQLYPRAAYYVLEKVHQYDPFKDSATLKDLEDHFDDINIMGAVLRARSDNNARELERLKKENN
ncbi:hypothetical protein GCM10010465_05440 [Actinomadura fibrosa]